jgi:hypothetical protein
MACHAFIAKLPFFMTYPAEFLGFLSGSLPLLPSDFHSNLPHALNLLVLYSDSNEPVQPFIQTLHFLADADFAPFYPFFAQFLSPNDQIPRELTDPDWKSIRTPFDTDPPFSHYWDCIVQVLKYRHSIAGLPFYLFLHDWAFISLRFPPYETRAISPTVFEVTFTGMVPSRVLVTPGSGDFTVRATLDGPALAVQSDSFVLPSPSFFIEFSTETAFVFSNDDGLQPLPYLETQLPKFVDDMSLYCSRVTREADAAILDIFGPHLFNSDKPTVALPFVRINALELGLPAPLVFLRAKQLFVFNWLVLHGEVPKSAAFDPAWVSPHIARAAFSRRLAANATATVIDVSVNRLDALPVRRGTSREFEKTLMYQMTNYSGDAFRINGVGVWSARLFNEHVADARGPARELVTELARELTCPACGLVVPVPNARYEIGANRDCVIPIQTVANLPRAAAQYRFAGSLIGIAIRSGLAQDFNFPKLVWQYFISERIELESICEIDQPFKMIVQAVKDAKANNEFGAKMSFVIHDFRGREIELVPNGRARAVTLANCDEFLALAVGHRVKELVGQLETMRAGLIGNLGFPLQSWITPEFLECSARGEAEISMDTLRRIVVFSEASEETVRTFWNIAEALTGAERSLLLMFATSCPRLPPNDRDGGGLRIYVGDDDTRDFLPRSQTCFYRIWLPRYSNMEIALRLVRLAISQPSIM